ncbi:MAG: DUF2589 domain-containing protein [Candidatus Pedobacter colombiensis]|uniref:DUF2589 domain-containing protein n=1 Tax=Candidatus Pedobacter colombiensis TaxID=3121371 RepID=A0AAJ5W5F2_9SPHI|nr:DUF2589 domain-containing protein [Pedobacter sp.]WEK17915.1 MAG: DUF2589 domain-containing protein [Pedobacter sp.]
MEEKDNLQINPQKLSTLITEPLLAAIAASNKMAKAQTDFILETCFRKNDLGQYEPEMIEMTLSQQVITPGTSENPETTFKNIDTTVKVPLLTIVPVNSMAINELTLNFDVEVLNGGDRGDKGLPELYGKVSGQKVAGKPILSFSIHTSQIPLPKGVNIIIDAFSQSIQAITKP